MSVLSLYLLNSSLAAMVGEVGIFTLMAGFGDHSLLQFPEFGCGTRRRQYWLGGRRCSILGRGNFTCLSFSAELCGCSAQVLVLSEFHFMIH